MTNGNSLLPEAEKAFDESQATRRSVVDVPPAPVNTLPQSPLSDSILWFIGAQADEMAPFGRNPHLRDQQLRAFITTESYFASALGIICLRNAGFNWKIEGPPRTASRFQDILNNANFGKGWIDFVVKVSMDLYTTDNGAFIEIIRETDSESAAVVGINHLDSARCWHTGAPEAPVIYQDRKGRFHLLKWYQVTELAEMPWPVEGQYGLQMCVLTRLLRSIQIVKNISQYTYEKTGGRHTRAIHLIKGVTAQAVKEALQQQHIELDARGLMRYSQPIMVGSVDPKADIGHDTIELASLPDTFNEETTLKWYIAIMAMAFGTDYQEFAPLPGGGLGTSSQSQILNDKTRGKGPAIWMALMSNFLNFRVLPDNCEFKHDEQDLDQEQKEAMVKKTRGEERALRIASQEITPEAARQMAHDSGDLPEEIFQALGGSDVTPDVSVENETQPRAQLGDPNRQPSTTRYPPAAPPATSQPTQQRAQQPQTPRRPALATGQREASEDDEEAAKAPDEREAQAIVSEERLALEEDVAGSLSKVFASVRARVAVLLEE